MSSPATPRASSLVEPSRRAAAFARGLVWLAGAGLFLLLVLGGARLLALRYARGDNFPPYSTLRTDPVGAKALADALALLPGVEVRRNYQTLNRLQPPPGAALVHLNLRFDAPVREAEFQALDRLVLSGTRAVFAFRHEFTRTGGARLARATPAAATPAPATAPPPGTPVPQPQQRAGFGALSDEPTLRQLAERWELDFDIAQDERRAPFHGTAEAAPGVAGVEASLPWHSALYFKALGERWRTLYTCNGVPVVIERPYGSGSLVLCADTFFLSNEGLRSAPGLIATLLGLPRTVIFDEASHGVTEEHNLATLARRLRLEGVAVVLAVLAGLFIWRNAVPLLPAATGAMEQAAVSGRDSGEGFINLLRRSVPVSQILHTSVAAWRRAQGRRLRAEEAAQVEAVLRGHEGRTFKDAAAAYRAVAEALARKTPHSTTKP